METHKASLSSVGGSGAQREAKGRMEKRLPAMTTVKEQDSGGTAGHRAPPLQGVAGAGTEPQCFAGSSHQDLETVSPPTESGWVSVTCFGQ